MNISVVYNFSCTFGLVICIWFFVYLSYKKTYSYGLEKIGKELMKWFIQNQANKKHVNNQFYKAGTFLDFLQQNPPQFYSGESLGKQSKISIHAFPAFEASVKKVVNDFKNNHYGDISIPACIYYSSEESPNFNIVKEMEQQEFVFVKPGFRRKYNDNYHHNEITFNLPYFDDETFLKMCFAQVLIVDSSDTSFCAKSVNINKIFEIESSKRLSPSLLLLQQPSVVSVGIISVFKNEAQVIYEWLLHHAKEGVSQFLLIDNNSTDDYHAQITKFLDNWKETKLKIDIKYGKEKHKQIKHIHDNDHLIKTTWCMSIDLDEFVYSRLGYDKITDYLENLETTKSGRQTEQVWLYWKMFGSNGAMNQPRSIISGFTKRQSFSNCMGNGKTMYRTREIDGKRPRMRSPHRAISTHKDFVIRDSMGRTMTRNPQAPRPSSSPGGGCKNGFECILHVNHYCVQSHEYFMKVKMLRGDVHNRRHENVRSYDYLHRSNKSFNEFDDQELLKKRGGDEWVSEIPKQRPWPPEAENWLQPDSW